MRVLLDTHAFLWATLDPDKLSPHIRSTLQNANTDVIVSAASAWEIAIKYRHGRLSGAKAVVNDYAAAIRGLKAQELDIKRSHALLAGSFPQAHRDKFDRILAAQAQIESLTLASRDHAMKQFGVGVIW